jgi:uncharacterized protein (DUF433 family)
MRKTAYKDAAQPEDPRYLPAYRIVEASRYLNIPASTLRAWVSGQKYQTRAGSTFFRPVIVPSSNKPLLLSFLNLVEAHVLDAIRQEYGIALPKVRIALNYISRRFPSEHPLAIQEFESDGLNLFIEKFGQLINITQAGQLAMREILQAYLRRIERDPQGFPCRLYPFTRKRMPDEPRVVVIDPFVSFGRPVLAGTGIPTAEIADRYKAGESIESLADDYGRERLQIEDAIRSELQLEAA